MKNALINTIVVLPDWDISSYDAARMVNSIKLNLPGRDFILISSNDWKVRHSGAFSLPVYGYDSCIDSSLVKNLICFEKLSEEVSVVKSRLKIDTKRTNIYRFLLNRTYMRARLECVEGPDCQDQMWLAQKHSFNRIAGFQNDSFCYFPYNYIFRQTGVGPLNEFGMRIDIDLASLLERDSESVLIIVFGGSAAWSLDCLHNEMFSYRLEEKLNTAVASTQQNKKYTVLNMAQHGNVVLNEMISYLLFAERLRPDYVIAHDGFNDFAYGVSNDQYLLQHCKIAYQSNLEQWAEILSGSTVGLATYHGESVHALRNPPDAVVNAYIERKCQFMKIAASNNANFIWGVQPFLKSKSALHEIEKEYLESSRSLEIGTQALAYQKMKDIMDHLVTKLPVDLKIKPINFHKIFANYGHEEHLFVDFVHTTPFADDLISSEYAKLIAHMEISKLQIQ